MFEHVLLQVGARSELLAAEAACVGFLPRVDPLVPYQIAYLQKRISRDLRLVPG